MITEACDYLATRSIVRREPLYSANRFARFVGDISAAEITSQHLDEARKAMQSAGLASRTIESTIADLITVIVASTGSTPGHGHRLQTPRPKPHPVEIDVIDVIWPQCDAPLRAWMALAFWTGLRLSDAMRWLLEHKGKPLPALISVTASKTKKEHVFPLPLWLADLVRSGPYRFRTVSDFARRSIRGSIHAACLRSGVEPVLPKQFRQRGVTEWTRANATAGAIIHGCGLGVLSHYLDPLSVLESAAPRVRVPSAMRGTHTAADEESTLLNHFRRMNPAAQCVITQTAEMLAAG